MEAKNCNLQAIVSSDLLEAQAVGDMAGSCDRTQAGSSDSSCTVVGITPRLAVALKDATKNSSDWNDEEEVELHVEVCAVGFGLCKYLLQDWMMMMME